MQETLGATLIHSHCILNRITRCWNLILASHFHKLEKKEKKKEIDSTSVRHKNLVEMTLA